MGATTDSNARTELAVRLARTAGALLMRHYGRLSGFEQKGAVNLVTEADRRSEALIVDGIRATFPGDAILGEEGEASAGHSGFEWIIDPLDGTTNFVHGYPMFMVSIGIREAGRTVGGVCHGPVQDELFVARRGQGATCNGARIAVSRVPSLSEALIGTGFPYNRREIVDELLGRVRRVLCSAHGIRRSGAASYDLCHIASGRLDGFFEQGLKPWDLCAGALMVEEAGGRLSAYDGGPFDLFGNTVVATNGLIHDGLLTDVVQKDDR